MNITGVQLEKGTIATPFEFRPFAVELQLCQRYYETMLSASYTPMVFFQPNNYSYGSLAFRVKKRSTPTGLISSASGVPSGGGGFSGSFNTDTMSLDMFGFGLAGNYIGVFNLSVVANAEL